MKTIIMADHAGFCFGVKRAVDAIVNALENPDKKEVWTIGLPIHNPQEVSRLQAMGLKVAQDESEVPSGAQVLIRAHGESRAVLNTLKERGVDVVETTCPFVSRAQQMAQSLSEAGYHIVLLGDANHPEIRGVMGHVDGSLDVVANETEALSLPRHGKVALISQTTQQEERLAAVAAVLTCKAGELHVCNTICRATVERQDAIRSLVSKNKVDGIVLIGGRASANTGKLQKIALNNGVDVLWVEDAGELGLNSAWFEGKNRIGIAAGASTPEWLINDISTKIASM